MSSSGEELTYRDGETRLTGLLYRGEKAGPAVLLIHGGAGLDDHAREQAQRWATLGYTLLACDMYGDEVVGDRDRIMRCLRELSGDPAALVRRAGAGLNVLREVAGTDRRVAAIGYCFGGMAALALARSGQEIDGVVSIHGSLATTAPARPRAVRAGILVCHGAADPHIPIEDVVAFTREMEDAGADWRLTLYGGAVHGFTHRQPPGHGEHVGAGSGEFGRGAVRQPVEVHVPAQAPAQFGEPLRHHVGSRRDPAVRRGGEDVGAGASLESENGGLRRTRRYLFSTMRVCRISSCSPEPRRPRESRGA